VLVDGRPERPQDHLHNQRGDLEILGHQPIDHLATLPSNRVGEHRREASDAVTVDVGADVAVCLAAADGVDERLDDCVLAVGGGRRHGRVDLPGGVPAWLLVVSDVNDADVDESVVVTVSGPLGEFQIVHSRLGRPPPLEVTLAT
jgi:hypothetical protein